MDRVPEIATRPVYVKLSWQLDEDAWKRTDQLIFSGSASLEVPPVMYVTLPGTDLYVACETQMCDSPYASPSALKPTLSLSDWLHLDGSPGSASDGRSGAGCTKFATRKCVKTDWLRVLVPTDVLSNPPRPRPLVVQVFGGPSSRLFLGVTCIDLAAAVTRPCQLHESIVPVVRHGRLTGAMRVSFVSEGMRAGRSASADAAVLLQQVEEVRATASCPASPRRPEVATSKTDRAAAKEGSDRPVGHRGTMAHLRQLGKKLLHMPRRAEQHEAPLPSVAAGNPYHQLGGTSSLVTSGSAPERDCHACC